MECTPDFYIKFGSIVTNLVYLYWLKISHINLYFK